MNRIALIAAFASIACNADIEAGSDCPDWHDHDGGADAADEPEHSSDPLDLTADVPYAPVNTIDFEPRPQTGEPLEGPGDGGGETGSSSVRVYEMPGNPTCADLGFQVAELKIDPPRSGQYGELNFQVDFATDGRTFDFESSAPVRAVIAKGGNAAMVYEFDPGVTYEWGFHAPINASGDFADLSHATFCL